MSLNSDATFTFELNSSLGTADKLIANGVTLNAASTFSITDIAGTSTALNLGTVLLLIDNTSASAITGTFVSLPENSILTAGANQFRVSYLGNTGNDVTLTVVPEPGALSALLGGMGVLLGLRRRKHSV